MLEIKKIVNPHAISESMARLEVEKVMGIFKRASALRNQTAFDSSLLTLLHLDVSAEKDVNDLEVEGALTEVFERVSKLPLAKSVDWARVVHVFCQQSRDFKGDGIRHEEPSMRNLVTDLLYSFTRSGKDIKGQQHYRKPMPVSRIEMMHEYFGVDLANQKDKNGVPLMVYLVSSNSYQAGDVDAIIKLGANPDATDKSGKCVLFHALLSHHGSKFGVDEMFREVLKHSNNLEGAIDAIESEFIYAHQNSPAKFVYDDLTAAKINQALQLINMEIRSRKALSATEASKSIILKSRKRVSL